MRSLVRNGRKMVSKTRSRGRDEKKRNSLRKHSPRCKRARHNVWSTRPAKIAVQPGEGWQVFCDLDGVLADFDRGVTEITGKKPTEFRRRRKMWRHLAPPRTAAFFADLPWMSDGEQLWEFLAPLRPAILSGSPSGDWAEPQKRKWCMEQLHLPDERVHIVDPADKSLYSHPGAVLVDDWLEHRAPWEARGGIFIHYTSAKKSIALLSGVLRHLSTSSPPMAAAPAPAEPSPLDIPGPPQKQLAP